MENQKGFSLMHIVVGVILVLLLSTVVIVSVMSYINDARLVKEMRELEEAERYLLMNDDIVSEMVGVENLDVEVRQVLAYHQEKGTNLDGMLFKNKVTHGDERKYVGELFVEDEVRLEDRELDRSIEKLSVGDVSYFKVIPEGMVSEPDSGLSKVYDVALTDVLNEEGEIDVTNSDWDVYGNIGDISYDKENKEFQIFINSGTAYFRYFLDGDVDEVMTVEAQVSSENTSRGHNSTMGFKLWGVGAYIHIYKDRWLAYGDNVAEGVIDNLEYHTYRMVRDHEELYVYVDEELVYESKVGSGSNQNMFFIGDGTSSGTGFERMFVKDFYMVRGEAIHP